MTIFDNEKEIDAINSKILEIKTKLEDKQKIYMEIIKMIDEINEISTIEEYLQNRLQKLENEEQDLRNRLQKANNSVTPDYVEEVLQLQYELEALHIQKEKLI